MRVVVTGGSGRLGQFVVRELFSHGHHVSVIDATKPRECLCSTYTADLSKAHALQDYFKSVEGVIHLARQRFPYTETGFNVETQRWEFADTVGDAERFNNNVAITNNVLAAAQFARAKKFVCGSSLAVYGLYYPVTAL
jgi:nucleoside-diphosphate-sugar epimerase